jgi:hypothetical protein
VNTDELGYALHEAQQRVLEIQSKLRTVGFHPELHGTCREPGAW